MTPTVHLKPGQLSRELAEQLATSSSLRRVQLSHAPNDAEVSLLNRVLEAKRDVALRFYSLPKTADLSVLGTLDRCRHLTIEHEIGDLGFLVSISQLTSLSVLVSAKVSLAPLARLPALEALSIGGKRRSLDGIEDVGCLTAILLGLRVESVAGLARLPRLRSLALDGGGLDSFEPLSDCKSLAHLRVNALKQATGSDLRPLAECASLTFLQLHELPQLGDLTFLGERELAALELITMNGMTSVEHVVRLQLEAFAMNGLWKRTKEIDLEPLNRCEPLRRISIAPAFDRARNGAATIQRLKSRCEALSIGPFREAVGRDQQLPMWFIG